MQRLSTDDRRCRFVKFVHSERFAPRAAPEHLSSPVYILLMNGARDAAAVTPSPDRERAAAAAQCSSLVRSLSHMLDPLTAPDAPLRRPLPCIQEVGKNASSDSSVRRCSHVWCRPAVGWLTPG